MLCIYQILRVSVCVRVCVRVQNFSKSYETGFDEIFWSAGYLLQFLLTVIIM